MANHNGSPTRSPEAKQSQANEQSEKKENQKDNQNLAPFIHVKNEVLLAAGVRAGTKDFSTLARQTHRTPQEIVNSYMSGATMLDVITEDAAKREDQEPNLAEQGFLKAMHWKAKYWQERAKGDAVLEEDYAHKEDKLAYSKAQDEAIRMLANKALANKDQAEKDGDTLQAERYKAEADDLERYRRFFNPQENEPKFKPNQNHAHNYMVAFKKSYATPEQELMMIQQAEHDRLFATYNSQIKDEMAKRLDKEDEKQLEIDENYVDTFSDKLSTRYKKMQRRAGVGAGKVGGVRDNYDKGVADLVDTKTRIAMRKARKTGEEFDEGKYIEQETSAIHTKRSIQNAHKHKGSGKWYSLNSLTGRNAEGKKFHKWKEKRVMLGFNALKAAGLIAGTVLTGGTGLVVASGIVAGTHFYMKREAKSREKRVKEVTAGLANEKAIKAAVAALKKTKQDNHEVVTRRDIINAINQQDKESNEKQIKKEKRARLNRGLAAGAMVGAGLVMPAVGADDWIVNRLHDVMGAGHAELSSWGDAWRITEWESTTPPLEYPDLPNVTV